MQKPLTEQQALMKLSALCSRAEHCSGEMADKMTRWGLSADVQERILKRLTEEKFIDDERYCRFFVRDKLRYNGWGRRKIEQALWSKHIDKGVYEPVLDEVPAEDYAAILLPLLRQKSKTVNGRNAYERKAKLIRFAMGRGYTLDVINNCLEQLALSDDYDYGVDGLPIDTIDAHYSD